MSNSNEGPLQKARKTAYRQFIVEAAEKVFAERGFEAAKIQDIADEAGVSVGTIYGVFGSKSELFGVVLTHRLPELANRCRETAISATTSLDRLTNGLNAYIIYLLEHPHFLKLHLREHSWGLGPIRATTEQLRAWREGLELEAAILKEAIEDGVVIEEDPHRLARCIMAVHQVQLWDWIENDASEPIDQVAARIDRLFRQMFCSEKTPRDS